MFFLTDDDERIAQIEGGELGERCIAGSDDRIVEQLGQLAELGFDEIIVPDFTLGRDEAERRAAYERFAADIAPQIS